MVLKPKQTQWRRSRSCEIVVCGYRRSSQRLEALPAEYKEQSPIAETGLAEGVTGKLSVESVEFIPGVKSNGVMITLTEPF